MVKRAFKPGKGRKRSGLAPSTPGSIEESLFVSQPSLRQALQEWTRSLTQSLAKSTCSCHRDTRSRMRRHKHICAFSQNHILTCSALSPLGPRILLALIDHKDRHTGHHVEVFAVYESVRLSGNVATCNSRSARAFARRACCCTRPAILALVTFACCAADKFIHISFTPVALTGAAPVCVRIIRFRYTGRQAGRRTEG